MKRIVRKVFAFIMAMVLCVTQLALPAMADTTTVTNPDGSTTITTTTTTPEPSGSTTSVESTTTSADGNTTTTTTDTTTTTTSGSGNVNTTDTSHTVTSETDSSSAVTSPDGSSGSFTTSHAESETNTDTTSTTITTNSGSSTVTNTETDTKAEDSTQTQNYFPGGTSDSSSGSGSTSHTQTETTENVTNNELMGSYEDTLVKDEKSGDGSIDFDAGKISDPTLTQEGNYETDSTYGTNGSQNVSTDMDFVGHTFEMKQEDIGSGSSAVYEAQYADDGILIQVLPGDFFEDTGTTAADGTPIMGLKPSGSEVTVGNRTWKLEYTEQSDGKVRNVTLTSSAIPEECYDNSQLKPSGTEVQMDGKTWIMNYTDADGGDMTFTLATGADGDNIVWDNHTPATEETGWKPTNAAPTSSDMTPEDYTGLGITPSYTDPDTNIAVPLPAVDFSKTGETDLLDAAGNVIGKRVITPETDGNGKIIAYKITDEVYLSDLTPNGDGSIVAESDAGQKTVSQTNVPGPDDGSVELVKDAGTPPTPYSVTNNGLTETLRVEHFTDAFGFPAYRTIKTVVDNLTGAYYNEEHEYYATVKTTAENIVTTPETGKRTLTVETQVQNGQKSHQEVERDYDTGEKTTVKFMDTQELVIVESEGEMYLKYRGELFKVEGSSLRGTNGVLTDAEKMTNGITSLQPDMSLNEDSDVWESYTTNLMWNSHTNILGSFDTSARPEDGYAWAYSEMGLVSRIMIDTHGNVDPKHFARQFVLKDSQGRKVFAYCMDAGTQLVNDAHYDMDNVADSGYTGDPTKAAVLQSIAMNGFWGTASGRGSLAESAKILLQVGYTQEEIDSMIADKTLNEGMLLAATQACLWRIANEGDDDRVNAEEMDKCFYDTRWSYLNGKNDGDNGTDRGLDNAQLAVFEDLYKAFLKKGRADAAAGVANTTELLDEDNFATEVTMRIESKVTALDVNTFNAAYANDEAVGGYYSSGTSSDGDGDIVDADGNKLFNTQMDFIVDVKQSDLTGNLTVRIIDADGNTIAKKQLATEDSNFFGKAIAGGAKTQYTFKNLILPNDTQVTLTIDGLQDMAEGAYLYSASNGRDAAQTFIGVASGSHAVHLSVDMKFTVTDPGANVSVETERERQKKVDTYANTQKGVRTDCSVDIETTVTMKTNVLGTKVHTKVVTEQTMENWKWDSYAEYLTTTVWDEDGGGDGGEVDDGLNIPDEAVPLAAAPKTGDASQILAIVCLVSMAGAWLLSKKEVQY